MSSNGVWINLDKPLVPARDNILVYLQNLVHVTANFNLAADTQKYSMLGPHKMTPLKPELDSALVLLHRVSVGLKCS